MVFEDGSRGRAFAYGKGLLTVAGERAYPPGRPLSLTVALSDGEVALSARCMGSKRTPDAGFEIRMRLTNLTRPARLALEASFD